MCGCAAAAMRDTSCRKLSRSADVRIVTRLIATFCPFHDPCTMVAFGMLLPPCMSSRLRCSDGDSTARHSHGRESWELPMPHSSLSVRLLRTRYTLLCGPRWINSASVSSSFDTPRGTCAPLPTRPACASNAQSSD